ncbi:hypothetical protein EZM97_30185 [Dyella soli]|uniref:Bacterial surface antigen (D15) domain-containing protein n=2 Tax=Dyella soli TaxID=522319 RepID=A0A4R0YRE3_9GAMM|nr:hypothetical protein EZM97_30185 [Dyella soli]
MLQATDAMTPAPPPGPDEASPHSWLSVMRDPQDGKFDTSRWLLEHRGFLLVPVIVTEPAVGNGGGLAAVFFHQPAQSDASKANGERIPPDIYGVGGIATENGTKMYGLGGRFHFKDDTWRYKGGLGRGSINLDFYTAGRAGAPRKIGYNLDGLFSLQQVSRRLWRSNVYVSARWVYIDLDSRLNLEQDAQYFTPKEFARKSSGLGLGLEYDSRDNTLTPSRGWQSVLEVTDYSTSIGSDNNYRSYRANTLAYLPLASDWILGLRADFRAARGDVPFYQLPSIDLRGIAYGRYQAPDVAMVEAELRWNFTPRWALLGFTGAGRAWGHGVDFGNATTETTRGLGMRYLIARQLGLWVGLDWAWGPDDHAYYIQVGSAWR